MDDPQRRARRRTALLRGAAAVLLGVALPAGAQPVFTDVTVAAGVDYLQYQVTNPPVAADMPYMTGGAAAADYDDDGWVDLYVTRVDASGILFRNRGDGTFEDVTGPSGLTRNVPTNGATWGDVDNDGDPDLYVTSLVVDRHYLYVNDAAGHFSEEAVARIEGVRRGHAVSGTSATFGDYDRDGWLDLYVGEWAPTDSRPSDARLLRNLGPAQPGYFADVTAAAGVTLASNLGSLTGYFPFAPRFADLDADGWPELVLTSDFGTSRLFWNDGDGTFTDGTVAAGVGGDENGMGSAIADWDGDGDLDWFITSIFDPNGVWGPTGNRLYRNEGNRVFSDVTDAAGVRDGFWGWGAAFFDYDNDTDLDLVMTNGIHFPFAPTPSQEQYYDDPMRLWRNDGPGPMPEISAAAGLTDTGSGKGLLTFDYDRDGDLDLFVVNNSGHPKLYRNDGGNQKNWLRVNVVGQTSNEDGLGTRIEVRATPSSPVRVQVVDAGSHFLGQSEKTAHFGLGPGLPGAVVYEVKAIFPSGRTRTLSYLSPNAVIEVLEPKPGCGLLGIEVLPILAGAAMAPRRRLRRGPRQA
jgi:hypothetical protein